MTIDRKDDRYIYMGENNDGMQYVCQYIVCSGSNNDPDGVNGITHLIEHYLIHSSCNNLFFNDTKIHGFTSFYYTCYYWYVFTQNEAINSFQEFDNVIDNIKEKLYNKDIFCGSKKEIVDEINYRIGESEKLSKLLFLLEDDKLEIKLPIGDVECVSKIEHRDVSDYLKSRYVSSNIYKYVYDRVNNIFSLRDMKLVKFEVPIYKKDNGVFLEKKFVNDYISEKIRMSSINQGLEDNSVKIVFKNNFNNSLLDIILGEIFLMQICNYLKKTMQISDRIEYENFFIDYEHLYFIITMNKVKTYQYTEFIKQEELYFPNILHEIIDEKGFNNTLAKIINYLINYERSAASEKEIRMDLINYSTLSYLSYNLEDHNEIVNKLKDLNYIKYYDYIFNKVQSINKDKIKIIY